MKYLTSAVLGLAAVMFTALAAYDAALRNSWSPRPFYVALVVWILVIDIITFNHKGRDDDR